MANPEASPGPEAYEHQAHQASFEAIQALASLYTASRIQPNIPALRILLAKAPDARLHGVKLHNLDGSCGLLASCPPYAVLGRENKLTLEWGEIVGDDKDAFNILRLQAIPASTGRISKVEGHYLAREKKTGELIPFLVELLTHEDGSSAYRLGELSAKEQTGLLAELDRAARIYYQWLEEWGVGELAERMQSIIHQGDL